MVIPISELVVFHEVTNGPFSKEDTLFASWSSTEEDKGGQEVFLQKLRLDIDNKKI